MWRKDCRVKVAFATADGSKRKTAGREYYNAGGTGEAEMGGSHLFVHFNVKAVGHLVILKQKESVSTNRSII